MSAKTPGKRAQKVPAECPRCALGDHGRGKRADGAKHVATEAQPTVETLIRWEFDGVGEATDGCRVEPDGRCPHGHSSWMLLMGVI